MLAKPDNENAFNHHPQRLAEAIHVATKMVPGMEAGLPLIMYRVRQCFKTFASESPERLNETQFVYVGGPIARVSHSGGLRSYIANKFPGDVDAEGLGTTTGKALLQSARFIEFS